MGDIYHAVRVSVPGDLSTVSVDTLEIPVLCNDEVLVHMEYSMVNPSDVNTANGKYPSGPPPICVGLEGSGTVVKSGGSDLGNSLVSKRVAVRGKGTWADYVIVKADSVFPLLDTTSFEQAANLVVNPMTVALFIEKIQKNGHKAAVQNAAASSLGQMLIKWCKILNIPLINLVRRQEQADILKNIGAEHVINTSEEDWKQKAILLSKTLGTTIAFDAIAGDSTSDLADMIEDGGIVYNYGRLSGQNCKFGPMHLIFQRKRLEGLWLTNWLDGKTYEERVEIGFLVQRLISEVFGIEHARVICLADVQATLMGFNDSSMTNNKILLRTRLG